MICSGCGAENKAGRRFCSECGDPLAMACARCGTPHEAGEKFCGECGAPLPAAKSATPAASPPAAEGRQPFTTPPAQGAPEWSAVGAPPRTTPPATAPGMSGAASPGGSHGLGLNARLTSQRQAGIGGADDGPVAERRLVSVLFADLVGFTPFAEERDSEDVRETLSRYFEIASEIIGRYGGTVEKFIGDAVMAVWGTPTSREDDAERSVRAALDLVDAVGGLGPGIQARVGVLTGEAAVSLGATNQGMVAGDIVNTAARLQSVAVPGTVFVGESTCRAASSAIAFEPVGDQDLKGKTAPVPAFRAMRVIAERGGRGRADTLEAPFVGRDDELRHIKELYHATAREGRTRLVSVTGVAGIGKSRLAWEFEKYMDGIVETVRWHRGRCPSYGDGLSFWPLGEMIRRRAGLAETDDEATTRRKLAALVATQPIDEGERRWIEPALLALLGYETGIGSEQLFGAWRTFFERMAGEAPVVMVFEDLHWADTGTLDFIDHLLEWTRNVPLYILTLARPELLDRRPDWGAGHRNFSSLYLEPLNPGEMGQLLHGLIPGLPDPAVHAVVKRAEGIPLYAVETVRMLVSEGKLEPIGDGTYRPTGDLTKLAVPETLTSLIAARLDSLEPSDRSLVLDAAVLGQSFTVPGLSAVSGIAENELEPRLRTLVRRELFAHETDPRSPERGQYAFVQAMIREVAYHTLAKKDRKTRHVAAARFYESLGTDETAAALAGHYLAARDNAPDGPEANALAGQARLALRGAAERAAALGGHDQALTFLVQALGITTEAAERAELLERAGGHATTAGRQDIAAEHLREAVEVRRELGDRAAIANAIAQYGSVLNQSYRTVEALALLEPAAAEFADLGDDPSLIALLGQLARTLFLLNRQAEAISVADRVLAVAEPAQLDGVVADTLVTKGTVLSLMGRPIEGVGTIRAGQALAEAKGLVHTVLRAMNNRNVTEGLQSPRTSLETALSARALAERLGIRAWVMQWVSVELGAAVRTGDWDGAIARAEQHLTEEIDPTERMNLTSSLVELRAYRGLPVDELLDELAGFDAATDDPQMKANLPSMRAVVAMAQGRHAEAREFVHQAIDINPALSGQAYLQAARLALWQRDVEGARADLAARDASGLRGGALDADRNAILAGIAALEGRSREAVVLYREAVRGWQDLELPWDEALTAIDMATLLDPSSHEVEVAAAKAMLTLERIGAKPFIERLEAALQRREAVPG